MPRVAGKKYAYNKEGKEAAAKAKQDVKDAKNKKRTVSAVNRAGETINKTKNITATTVITLTITITITIEHPIPPA